MINNIKALMENHTATEKWRAESVGKLNLVSTIHKDGSRIKKAFILAKKCLVYNDCITEWKSSRIDAKDQVDIKLYYGEEVIQRFYNADLLWHHDLMSEHINYPLNIQIVHDYQL